MTAPNGSIVFNNSTGSDTQSSGLGPSAAVYGSGASTTGSSAVVTGIDTTGVSAGDLLWVQSSSGRQFSIIASVDSSTQVTCDDQFANTEGSRTWAVGGKRSTLENASSRQIMTDLSGITLEIQSDQTITTPFSMGNANNKLMGDSISDRHTITQSTASTDIIHSQNTAWYFNLKFKGGDATCFNNGGTSASENVYNCIIGDQTDTVAKAHGQYGAFRFYDSVIQYCTVQHDIQSIYSSFWFIRSKYIHNEYSLAATHGNSINYIEQSLFANNTRDGFRLGLYQTSVYVAGCTFANNGGHGLTGTYPPRIFYDNIVANNGGYGINVSNTSKDSEIVFVNNNQWYNNTSGDTYQFSKGTSDVSSNPQFTDATNGNFTTNQPGGNIIGDIDAASRLTRGYAGIKSIPTGGTMKTHPLT